MPWLSIYPCICTKRKARFCTSPYNLLSSLRHFESLLINCTCNDIADPWLWANVRPISGNGKGSTHVICQCLIIEKWNFQLVVYQFLLSVYQFLIYTMRWNQLIHIYKYIGNSTPPHLTLKVHWTCKTAFFIYIYIMFISCSPSSKISSSYHLLDSTSKIHVERNG